MVAQAGVESSPESSSSKKDGDDADDDDARTRIGFVINNNGLLWAGDHRTVTGLIFAGTLVACERVAGVGV